MTFVLARGRRVVWAITGPLFGYSDTWQLIINTGTTIVTFLLVFLIQATQNRHAGPVVETQRTVPDNQEGKQSHYRHRGASDEELENAKVDVLERAGRSQSTWRVQNPLRGPGYAKAGGCIGVIQAEFLMAGVIERNNVHVSGSGDRAMIFAHGFGCDQNMWRFVAPAFEKDFMTVIFDHVGAGNSDLSAYDRAKYSSLAGYADDVIEIGTELGFKDSVFVGHSVSSMIGVLAARQAPGMFGKLVLIGPSARYIDDEGYVGGFSARQIEELLQFLESNHMGWSKQMAPTIMGNPDRPELGQELTNSFCRTDPEIAKAFARVTFTSDNREDLAEVTVPTLVLQCSEDIIASEEVGAFVTRNIPNSRMIVLDATGHCPNLSAPKEVIAAMRTFVQ